MVVFFRPFGRGGHAVLLIVVFVAQLRATDLARTTNLKTSATPSPSALPFDIATYSTKATVTYVPSGEELFQDVQKHQMQ